MDADPVGELHLRQFALAAKLPDLPADELELCWLIHAGFVDFYGVDTIKSSQSTGSAPICQAERVRKTHRNVHLLRELIKRDFHARFTGSVLGVFWAVLQPLSLVILYWFIFTYMFPRGPGARNDNYIDFLIAGLLPWLGFNEGLIRSATSIVDNAAMVRRLAFRSELLIVVPNASALIFESIAFALFIGFLLLRGLPSRLVWLLPFVLLVQFVMQVGIGWILAATYVFFRDLMPILGFLLSVIFYLSPILYPVAGRFERFFIWNPMTPLLGLFRSAVLSDSLPPAGSIVFLLAVTSAMFIGGLLLFRRAQGTLADLI
jgi:lipopolysaccharide transport system permease protein